MGRSRRRSEIPEYEHWIAIRDARGQWVVVNDLTHSEILRDPDPAIRAANCHLAAAAPIMRAALEAILRKLHNAQWVEETGDHRRARVVQFAWGAYAEAAPHGEALFQRPGILELTLDADSADTPKEAA